MEKEFINLLPSNNNNNIDCNEVGGGHEPKWQESMKGIELK